MDKVLQECFTDVIIEMADGQTYPLSPKEASHWQKSTCSCLDQGAEILPAEHLLDAGQRA